MERQLLGKYRTGKEYAIAREYLESEKTNVKESLCRFYLRGLCVFGREICQYSHGIDDLKFRPYIQGQPIKWVYERSDFNQSPLIPIERRYINLYEYQKVKLYTEDQLNSDRKLREVIRNEMLKEQAEKFINLLKKVYPQQALEEKFLEREFTRAGFNKPTSTINFKKICELLGTNSSNGKFHEIKSAGKSILVQTLNSAELEQQYTDILRKTLLSFKDSTIPESQLKRLMFQDNGNPRLLKLNLHLKNLRISFMQYVQIKINSSQQLQHIMKERNIELQNEPTLPELTDWAQKQLKKQPCIVPLDPFMDSIAKEYKISNHNTVNPVKLELINRGFQIYYLPMISFIYDPKGQAIKHIDCPCSMKALPDLSGLVIQPPKFPIGQIEVIDSDESFQRCCWDFLRSQILAIDLEGRLRKGGFIEMLQFNNGKNVFLFDIYKITQLDFNFELFQQIKLLLREKLLDAKVLKIFHDCRHDCLSLHEIINSCTINVFDTSGMEIFRNQWQQYHKIQKWTNPLLNSLINVRTPGLNELFKKYEAPHGLNESKDEFHKMMAKTFSGIFHQRPLNPEYKKYCVKDVLDLIHVHMGIKKGLPEEVYKYVGDRYVQFAYEQTL